MADLSEFETKDVTVAGLLLTAPCPYVEGHVLSDREAGVVNQTYHENLRNNFAARVKKAMDEAKVETAAELPGETKEALAKSFWDYAEGYELGEGGKRESDPIKAQAMQLAIGRVKEKLKAEGVKLSEVTAEKIRSFAEGAIAKYPKYMEKAKEIVEARKAAAAELQVDL